MRELAIAAGRPMAHDMRAMVAAVAYVTRNGIDWRAMPADFPPWDSVYAFWQRWNGPGQALAILEVAHELLTESATVSMNEIAKRAGVGAGTCTGTSRHAKT